MSDANPEVGTGLEPAHDEVPVVHPPFSAEGLKARFPDAAAVSEFRGEITMVVPADQLVETCVALRDEPDYDFNVLSNLSAVDHLPRLPRFDVNYHLVSIPHGRRLRVKAMLPGPDPTVESVTGVWGTANWWEREVFDLMGVTFTGHPDLRRIQMTDDWVGHPHRRDYPTGKQTVTFTPPPR